MIIKCKTCGDYLSLSISCVTRTKSTCDIKLKQSLSTGQPMVVRGQTFTETPNYKYYYSIICPACEATLFSSESYEDITNYVLENWTVLGGV